METILSILSNTRSVDPLPGETGLCRKCPEQNAGIWSRGTFFCPKKVKSLKQRPLALSRASPPLVSLELPHAKRAPRGQRSAPLRSQGSGRQQGSPPRRGAARATAVRSCSQLSKANVLTFWFSQFPVLVMAPKGDHFLFLGPSGQVSLGLESLFKGQPIGCSFKGQGSSMAVFHFDQSTQVRGAVLVGFRTLLK